MDEALEQSCSQVNLLQMTRWENWMVLPELTLPIIYAGNRFTFMVTIIGVLHRHFAKYEQENYK